MAKTILCYGDSLTWGFDAAGPGRHAHEDRWPSVVQAELGASVRVVAEGLCGRTTAFDDHLAAADRNGARVLPTILATHEPVDLLILALGTNNLKRHTGGGTAAQAARGIERLIEIIRGFSSAFDFAPPAILLVSPPPLVPTDDPDAGAAFGFALAESGRFAEHYAPLAERYGCDHLAAADHCAATQLDGVHLDAPNTRALGSAVAAYLKTQSHS